MRQCSRAMTNTGLSVAVLQCCNGFADLGDPEAPEWDVDTLDEVGMSVEELEKLLAEGKVCLLAPP